MDLANKLRDTTPAPFWSIPLESASADILERVDDDVILVGTVTWNDKYATFKRGPVRAVEVATGNVLWTADSGAIPAGQTSVIAVDPNILVTTATAESWVIATIDRDSGKTLWARGFGRRASFARATVLGRPALVVADESSLHAIELTSGSDLWNGRMAPGQSPLAYSVWISEPAAYVITDRVQRFALDSGRLEWTSNETLDVPVTEALRVGDQLLTVGASGIASVSTIDGRVSWHEEREGLKPYHLTILNQQLLVAWRKTTSSIASELTMLDAVDGSVLWHTEPLLELRGGPLIDDDGFIIVTNTALILRLDPRTGGVASRGKLPLELISKQGLPDRLSLRERKLYLRRERGVAIFDVASMRHLWSFPTLGGRDFEWSRLEQDHYSWLGGNAIVPQQTLNLLSTAQRASSDALFQRTLLDDDAQHIVSDDVRLASDALHAYIAAQSQAYLDDRRARALYVGADMRAAQHDYFDAAAGFTVSPAMHTDNRLGVVFVDPVARRAGAVWAGPRLDDTVPLAIIDRKHQRVITVAPSFDWHEHSAYTVRGEVHHTVSLAAYALSTIEIKSDEDAAKASAELVGVDPREIEGPRLIVAHEGSKLARRYADHGCPKDYASQQLIAGSLGHYAVIADETEMMGGLVRDGFKTDVPTNADYTVEELAQLVGSQEMNAIIREPDATVNDALRAAAANGSTAEVLRLLGMNANPNAGLNVPGCDFGPLHFAIVKHDTRMADALLKAGAWVNFQTPEGTALDLANGYKAPRGIVNGLKQRGAKRGAALPKKEAPASESPAQETPSEQTE